MDVNKETFETWNKVAALYEEKFMHLDLYNESYDRFCEALVKHNSSVLEVGCGPGNITKYLLSKRPDLSVLAIDVAPKMIELAAKNNPTAQVKVMDCREISEIAILFDGIICGFCLPYLSGVESVKFISDCKNLLQTNGVLYISFVDGEETKSGFQIASSGDRAYFNYHRTDNIVQVLLSNGFELPKIIEVDYEKSATKKELHTILLTKKIAEV